MSPTEAAPERRRTTLVTGASRGIGLELARLFAADGYDLVLVARGSARAEDGPRLEPTAGGTVRRFSSDLGRPGAASELWSEIERAGIAVDVLVNNAGSGLYGAVAEQEPEALRSMLELNITALTTLTRLALPGMLARGFGRILNVASIVAFQPGGPRMSAYYASKAYVLSFSKGLARELEGSGVSVTALCPGTTATAFEERSGAAASRLYRWLPPSRADAVARAGYRGLERGARVVIPGLLTKLLAFAGELPPRAIALEVNRQLLKRS